MNRKFLHEHHNRQDKVRKALYRDEIKPAQNKSWSGINVELSRQRSILRQRKAMLEMYGDGILCRPYQLCVCTVLRPWFESSRIDVSRLQKVIRSELGKIRDFKKL